MNLKKKQPSTNLDQIKIIEPDEEKERGLILLLTCNMVALIKKEIDLLLAPSMLILKLIDQMLSKWNKFYVIFILKMARILTIVSDYGIYNNVTDDMEFTENVKMNYLENVLFSEKVNFFNVKNELLIEGNVKTTSPEGELRADKLDFDLDSKN